MEHRWKDAVLEIKNTAMEAARSGSESEKLARQNESSDEDVSGETMMGAVASMVRDLVEEHKIKHPEDFADSKSSSEHYWLVSAAFAEAVHSVQFDRAGPLRDALLSNTIQKVVISATVRKLRAQLDSAYNQIEHIKAEYQSLESKANELRKGLKQAKKDLEVSEEQSSKLLEDSISSVMEMPEDLWEQVQPFYSM